MEQIAEITRLHFGSHRGAVVEAHRAINERLAPDGLDYSSVYAYYHGTRRPRSFTLRLLSALDEGDIVGNWARACIAAIRADDTKQRT